jgi:hypothetical protein
MKKLQSLVAHFADTWVMEIHLVKSITFAMLEGVIILLLSVCVLSIIVAILVFMAWVGKRFIDTMVYLRKIY